MNQQMTARDIDTASKAWRTRLLQERYLKIFKDEGNGGNGEVAEAQPAPVVNSAVSHLADLAVEAGIVPDRAAALRFLLRNKNGTAILQRLGPHLRKRVEPAREEKPMQTAKQRSDAAVKRALGHISEHQYTSIVTEYAKERYPNDRPDVAFNKVYTEASDEGAAIRAARQQIKQRQYATQCRKRLGDPLPFEVTLEPREVDALDPDEALKQLHELAAEQRRRAPWMTTAQAFSAIYGDPHNATAVQNYKEARRRQLGA
jgi:hypothetical protein